MSEQEGVRTIVLTVDLNSVQEVPNVSRVDAFVRKVVLHNMSIVRAKQPVDNNTPLGPKGHSIAESVMKQFGVSQLEIPEPCSIGKLTTLIKEAMRKNRNS